MLLVAVSTFTVATWCLAFACCRWRCASKDMYLPCNTDNDLWCDRRGESVSGQKARTSKGLGHVEFRKAKSHFS